MKAIRVHAHGGPESLRFEEVPDPVPAEGQALVRIEAAGVNFIDVYHRTGLYKVASLPFTPGQEAAGTVEAVGPGVSGLAPGDAVAYCGVMGAYAEKAVVPADRLVRLPEGLGARDGAAAMLQGMTAHYLATSTFPLNPGDACLVHAAAGGVGLLLCQIAKMRAPASSPRPRRRKRPGSPARPARTRSSSTPSRTLRPRSGASPVSGGCRWSMTAWDRRRSTRASTPWPGAA